MATKDKEPNGKKKKPTVKLSGGINSTKKYTGGGIGGSVNLPIVQTKNSSISLNISGDGGGVKPKGGPFSGRGNYTIGGTVERNISGKKSKKTRHSRYK